MQVVLENVRFSYFYALEARAYEGDEGKEKKSFSTKGLFPKGPEGKKNFDKLMAAIKKEAVGKWQDKAPAILKTLRAKDRLCLHDGDQNLNDEGEAEEGYSDMWFVSCSQSDLAKPPQIFSQSGRKVTIDNRPSFSEDDAVPYSGCYGRLLIEVWAQDNKWGKRVNARFLAASFSEHGEPFGAQGISADAARDALGLSEPDPVGDIAESEGSDEEPDLDDLFADV